MIEKYRIQAKTNGEWKTQLIFSEDETYHQVRMACDRIMASGGFEDVRILEVYKNVKSGKPAYRESYSFLSSAVEQEQANSLHDITEPIKPSKHKVINGITGEWIELDEQYAKKHPLYGIYGWLAYFASALFVGPLLEIVSISYNDKELANNWLLFSIVFVLMALFAWVPLWLLIKKSRHFPAVYVITSSILLLFSLVPPIDGSTFIAIGWIVLWLGYVLFSERVNVTMKHRVRRSYLEKPYETPTSYVNNLE
ncbi:MAG: hypothetical protein HWE30_00345 [Methylocystaceae bacterium]|nr:hypothetical protein [Methylocystaceae bacterium]